ncbi:hypothetical protein SAMN05444340_1443 [Citreimonas salinaria]|uniref:Uncharacterized protein n=1 Tax=Citreimonas salinaria TaxID=321339 RepID=A0A1H3P2I8_9RHOB|nr:hypothetical protein SAMN05444340_1443 [Citreimonas salinaria]
MSACYRRARIFMQRHPALIVRGSIVLLLLVHAALLVR